MSTSGAPNAAPNGPLERPVSEALASFRRGEITLDDYLEAQVDTAVAHLKGRVSEERLQTVREVLLESLRSDPDLAESVLRLTGQSPAEPTS